MARRIRLFSPAAFEPALARNARKTRGIYYTPPEIVRQIVGLTIGPLLGCQPGNSRSLRILDPSCGAGEFLVGAFQTLAAHGDITAARLALWGLDIDSSAVGIARSRLRALGDSFPANQLIVADALKRSAVELNSFDAIIGNPPYINIRQLSKVLSGEQIQSLRKTYSTARGNFDLYVLFIERAIELLRPGGRCGLIVPGKWATLDYARECRKLLLSKTTIEHIVDLSDSRVFAAASVYPHILVFKKAVARPAHCVQVDGFRHGKTLHVRQATLSTHAIQLSPALDVESRISAATLGSLATITCGTAGYAAQKIARRIIDAAEIEPGSETDAADFITSGNIDRYRIRLGDVRYLNRRYFRPKLPRTAPELTQAKRHLFESQKIVVAGMSRRLEAAWDSAGLALGVQVYALSATRLDPFYLLALLNSKLLSYLFATRFAAKRLSGGYLAINKGQLACLPIRVVAARDRVDARRIRQLSHLAQAWLPAHETPADNLVYELYRLTDAEITRVEAHFGEAAARAA